MPPDCLTMSQRLSALELENARLRQLLDDIHRGRAPAPGKPKDYGEAITRTTEHAQETNNTKALSLSR